MLICKEAEGRRDRLILRDNLPPTPPVPPRFSNRSNLTRFKNKNENKILTLMTWLSDLSGSSAD